MVILVVKWKDTTTSSDYWLDSRAHFRSFFSTIWNRLEHRQWGSRFPVMMNRLFLGEADASEMDALAAELKVIQEELRKLPVYELTWNYEQPDACPPDGMQFDAPVRTCEDFFCHYNGLNLFNKLWECIKEVKYHNTSVHVISSFYEPLPQMFYDVVQEKSKQMQERRK